MMCAAPLQKELLEKTLEHWKQDQHEREKYTKHENEKNEKTKEGKNGEKEKEKEEKDEEKKEESKKVKKKKEKNKEKKEEEKKEEKKEEKPSVQRFESYDGEKGARVVMASSYEAKNIGYIGSGRVDGGQVKRLQGEDAYTKILLCQRACRQNVCFALLLCSCKHAVK